MGTRIACGAPYIGAPCLRIMLMMISCYGYNHWRYLELILGRASVDVIGFMLFFIFLPSFSLTWITSLSAYHLPTSFHIYIGDTTSSPYHDLARAIYIMNIGYGIHDLGTG